MARKKATPEDDDAEVRSSALALAERVRSIRVTNAEEFSAAGGLMVEVKNARKKIADFFKPMKEATHAAWKAVTGRMAEVDAPLASAEAALKPALGAYQDRIAREQILAAEAAREISDEALALEERGDAEGAAALMGDAGARIPEAPKVAGLSFREDWQFEILDANLIPREFLVPDEGKIRGYVKAMKGSASIPGVKVKCVNIPVGR